jgi:TRAP-type transport system periplasmic protein
MESVTMRWFLDQLPIRAVAATTLIVTAFAWAAPAQAETSRVLRMGYILAADSQLGAGAAAMGEELAKRTGGRLTIEQFPNAALGGEVEMLKGVQLGTIDLAFITGAPLPNFVADVGVFNIPFLFRDAAHAHGVLDSPIGQSYLQKFRAKDLVALVWGENGMRHITNAKRPIVVPEDLKGLRLRLPQSEVMLVGFKTLGADASPLPFPQLYDALKSGQFDGQENPIATILASKFAQVQSFLTLSGHVYDPAIIVMSVDAFDDLTDSDRQAVIAAAKVGAEASRTYAAAAERKGVAALAQAGMQVTTQIDRSKFIAALAAAAPEFERRFGAETIAAIRSFE